jgi:hypothetical protein
MAHGKRQSLYFCDVSVRSWVYGKKKAPACSMRGPEVEWVGLWVVLVPAYA